MSNDKERMVIRNATSDDARQIAEIIVEDWKIAYKGIIDDDYLDFLDVEERYQRELQRYQVYNVAAVDNVILGLTWNDMTETDESDCEIIALYVRYTQRKNGIGKILFQNSVDHFRASGKKKMIIWCLKDNSEARKFYEKMGGKEHKAGTHRWGNRDYDMISYIYDLDVREI